MAVISQTTFSNVFSWMKMYDFRLRFQWSLFLRFQLTKFQHSDNGLAPSRHALWLSGAIRRQWYGPTSAQMMACRLTAPSRHLNQCWLIIKDVLWHLSKSHFARSPNELQPYHVFRSLHIWKSTIFPRGQWVNAIHTFSGNTNTIHKTIDTYNPTRMNTSLKRLII